MLEMRFEPPHQLSLWADPPELHRSTGLALAAAPAPRPSPEPGADPAKDDNSSSVPRIPDPANETDENDADPPPHHPEGPKRYHDDYASPRRMSHEGGRPAMMEC
ncbi:hypothetical protein SAMN05216359_10668 [Roseateles sp. YR242]|nr:hypothetical protein SAMN05216359_10668 [Roseateles sp. YR242]